MRKFVLILLSLLTPFGIWSAGCRQETGRAPMPNGPEIARLARAPGAGVDDSIPSPPTIPALIDPEIIATPDQPTFARIRAVMDREESLAGDMTNPGLFVLPRQDYFPEMAVAPQPAPQMTQGMEIWSRPVYQEPSAASPRQNLSPDLAAMAPGVSATPPPANQFAAYPSYSMPDASGLTPLAPMTLPAAPALLPPPSVMQLPAPPVSQPTGEIPADIPGLYFGPDDLILSAISSKYEAQTKKEPDKPDFFGDPDLGLLASTTSLDDLTSFFLAEAPKPPAPAAVPQVAVAAAAAPPWVQPAPAPVQSPTAPSGLLDFSMGKLINTPPAIGDGQETEPLLGRLDAPASLSIPPDLPTPIESAEETKRAETALALEPVPAVSVTKDVAPPPLLSLESFSSDEGFGGAAMTDAADKDSGSWDAFRPPVKLDRQSAALDPLIDYDFSAFAKREERPAAQKVRLTPAEEKRESGKTPSYSVEPEAPPLL